MRCAEFLRELCDYLDGETAAGLCAEIDDHMRRCPKCRIVVETCRTTVSLYGRQLPPEIPAALHARVMAAVARQRGSQSR